ncbi:Protein of unknown function [Gryllus bimaculatus]|nr:Protein of unknown function [Gryllus bimaculatus]
MARTATSVTVVLVALAALSSSGRAFFLPSYSSSSSTNSGYKKPEVWTTQEFGQYALGGHALPLAVPYPVPPFAQLPQLAPVPGVGGAAAALYQSMQLVPCLCSVPKEDVDDAAAAGNSVAVNAASAPPQPGHGN